MALRFLYDVGTPTMDSTGRNKRRLDVLIADESIDASDATRLARIQLLNWYFEDLGEADMNVVLHIPEQAATLISVFDSLGVSYSLIPRFDETDAATVSRVVLKFDCDVVLSKDSNRLHPSLTDDSSLVTDSVAGILREAELHAKGFNAPWSFESPCKNQPWMQFYAMSEHSIFRPIIVEWEESRKASPATAEAMRVLVLSLQSICFSRDRMAFYRQQDRWAHRSGLERQDFRFEYTTYLNHFYFSLYAAVDQAAYLVVRAYNLPVPESHIGALYAAFQLAIKQRAPEIHVLFNDDAFWEMYRLLRDMRRSPAHRGPLTQEVIYNGNDEFTDEQLDAKAAELGYLDDANAFTGEMRDFVIAMARHKAKLVLLGPPLKHMVLVRHEDGSATFYNPDPHADLDRFLLFLHRLLGAIKPWDKDRAPTREALITRWKSDSDSVGIQINNVWTVWEHFKIVYAVGMSNPRVTSHPSAIYMFLFIARAIVEWVMLGVRRQVDIDSRSVSLFNLLTERRDNPTVYDLGRCTATFRARAMLVAPERQERYENDGATAFAAIADDSGLNMSAEKITKDIDALKNSCKTIVGITNRYIAHNSRSEGGPDLPVEQIDDNVNKIYSLTRKYGRLFDAFGVGPNGLDAESMRSLFSFPWVENEIGEPEHSTARELK
jgi:hypothetical protein